jgi:hypothetical protein
MWVVLYKGHVAVLDKAAGDGAAAAAQQRARGLLSDAPPAPLAPGGRGMRGRWSLARRLPIKAESGVARPADLMDSYPLRLAESQTARLGPPELCTPE